MPVSTENHTLPSALSGVEKVFNVKMADYIEKNRRPLSDALDLGGTLSNLETGIAYAMESGLDYFMSSSLANMNSGCVAISGATYSAIEKVIPQGWTLKHLSVGNVMEHHSVVVYKSGESFKKGFVFDSWIRQTPLIYSYSQWFKYFSKLSAIGKPEVS